MLSTDIQKFIVHCIDLYGQPPIPLHRPVFYGNEKQNLLDCIDSNFVSSAGEGVARFESAVAEFVGSKYAVATVNGTAALHVSLVLSGVKAGDEVITQALSFVATSNAVAYTGAEPLFIDVDKDTLGMSPTALEEFLSAHAEMREGEAWNKETGKRLSACLPMHTFGNPCRIREIVNICNLWSIPVIEDAAESLGSYVQGIHTGMFGQFGTFSFNGNKVITTGGGGMIVTNNKDLAYNAKHLTTTAKVPHPYEFEHNEIGYNYRLPSLNAVLGSAQMEQLERFLQVKAQIADSYESLITNMDIEFVRPLSGDKANNWLNAIVLNSRSERDEFLVQTNNFGVMTRPIWKLMTHLPMFKHCYNDGLENSKWLEDRVVNIPSSVP